MWTRAPRPVFGQIGLYEVAFSSTWLLAIPKNGEEEKGSQSSCALQF